MYRNSLLQFPWTILKYQYQHRHWCCHEEWKKFILAFEISCVVKYTVGSPLKVCLQVFLESVSCCLEQLLFSEPVSARFRRKKLHIGSYFRSFKNTQGWSCSLRVFKFLLKNPIRDHFPEIFSVTFKTLLRNLVRSSFLVALQIVWCKPATLGKKGLLKISRKVTFWNIPCKC